VQDAGRECGIAVDLFSACLIRVVQD